MKTSDVFSFNYRDNTKCILYHIIASHFCEVFSRNLTIQGIAFCIKC